MIIKLNRDGKTVSGDNIVIDSPDIYQNTRLVHELVIRLETYAGETLAVSFSDGNGKRITDNYMMLTRKYSDAAETKRDEFYLPIPNAVLRDYGKKVASVVVLDLYDSNGNDDMYRIITSKDIAFTVQQSHGTVDFEPVQIGMTTLLPKLVNKNLYNLGMFDTFISNDDGTVTITRKTKYNGDGTQEELAEQHQYSENTIENQPMHHLNQDGENWAENEFRKGLNLWRHGDQPSGTMYIDDMPAGTYTMSLQSSGIVGVAYMLEDGSYSSYINVNITAITTFEIPLTTKWKIYFNEAATHIMLARGKVPYPYEPYRGEVAREKDLDEFYSADNPPPVASQNQSGTIKAYTTTVDGKMILHIDTE